MGVEGVARTRLIEKSGREIIALDSIDGVGEIVRAALKREREDREIPGTYLLKYNPKKRQYTVLKGASETIELSKEVSEELFERVADAVSIGEGCHHLSDHRVEVKLLFFDQAIDDLAREVHTLFHHELRGKVKDPKAFKLLEKRSKALMGKLWALQGAGSPKQKAALYKQLQKTYEEYFEALQECVKDPQKLRAIAEKHVRFNQEFNVHFGTHLQIARPAFQKVLYGKFSPLMEEVISYLLVKDLRAALRDLSTIDSEGTLARASGQRSFQEQAGEAGNQDKIDKMPIDQAIDPRWSGKDRKEFYECLLGFQRIYRELAMVRRYVHEIGQPEEARLQFKELLKQRQEELNALNKRFKKAGGRKRLEQFQSFGPTMAKQLDEINAMYAEVGIHWRYPTAHLSHVGLAYNQDMYSFIQTFDKLYEDLVRLRGSTDAQRRKIAKDIEVPKLQLNRAEQFKKKRWISDADIAVYEDLRKEALRFKAEYGELSLQEAKELGIPDAHATAYLKAICDVDQLCRSGSREEIEEALRKNRENGLQIFSNAEPRDRVAFAIKRRLEWQQERLYRALGKEGAEELPREVRRLWIELTDVMAPVMDKRVDPTRFYRENWVVLYRLVERWNRTPVEKLEGAAPPHLQHLMVEMMHYLRRDGRLPIRRSGGASR